LTPPKESDTFSSDSSTSPATMSGPFGALTAWLRRCGGPARDAVAACSPPPRQPLGGLVGERAAAAEAGQHHLGAVVQRLAGDRVGDRVRREHAGDEQPLAVDEHRAPP